MAKTKKSNQIENEELDKFLERMYGEGVMETADKALAPRSCEVLHGPLSLDIALNGGLAGGSICLITGKPKVGKSSLCLEFIKNAQQQNRPTFYINIERRCTPSLLGTIQGLDTTKLQVIPSQMDKPLTAEDYLNIIESIIKTQPRALIVVDSLAMLSTMVEQEETIGANKDMGGTAKLISSFFRRMQQIIDANNVIVIFISQLISNRSPHGKKWIEKGGIAIQYACSTWLTVAWIKPWEKNVETNAPDGHDLMITVNSSAMGRPFLPCVLPLRYGTGIDNIRDVTINAENLGLIEKKGSWYVIPLFAKNEEDSPKYQGLGKLANFFKDNPDKLKRLEREIRDIVLPQTKKENIGDNIDRENLIN